MVPRIRNAGAGWVHSGRSSSVWPDAHDPASAKNATVASAALAHAVRCRIAVIGSSVLAYSDHRGPQDLVADAIAGADDADDALVVFGGGDRNDRDRFVQRRVEGLV